MNSASKDTILILPLVHVALLLAVPTVKPAQELITVASVFQGIEQINRGDVQIVPKIAKLAIRLNALHVQLDTTS